MSIDSEPGSESAKVHQGRRRLGSATRRSRFAYTPDDLLSATLGAPLLWPGRTIRVSRDSLIDYMNRGGSPQVAVSELYHENSKMTRVQLPELAFSAVDVPGVRLEFARRRAARAAPTAGAEVDAWTALADQAFAASPDLFYALELRLVSDGKVFAYEPGAGMAVISQLAADDEQAFVDAVRLAEVSADADASVLSPDAGVVVLLGTFGRNEVLFGVRGYRRTLLEAGQLSQEIARIARQSGRAVRVRFEFADREIDLLMEADGVEQSALVAIEVGRIS